MIPTLIPRPGETLAQPFDIETMRLEMERLRAFVEMRVQAQEEMARAMLRESVLRASEALEGRIQLATREAMAFAEQGLQSQEATLRALGRRVADLSRQPPARDPAQTAPAAVGHYAFGAGGAEAAQCRRLELRDDNEADLANLPILPGGAAKLVAAHVAESVAQTTLAQVLLPHWRSRLAPGGELVLLTLDGPAYAADLAQCADFATLRRKLGADGQARPLRQLYAAEELTAILRGVGLQPEPASRGPGLTLRIAAHAPTA